MAKSTARKGSKESPIVAGLVGMALQTEERNYVVIEAIIKDGFCIYAVQKTKGTDVGSKHKITDNPGIIDDDMLKAFSVFNVHIAVIDDAFKFSGIEIANIDNHHGDEITGCFEVHGFKIKGGKGNESIVLIGTKRVSSSGGRLEIVTPRIPLDNLSSYKWYNELKLAADQVREEVALYREGKCTLPEPDEDEVVTQLTIGSEETIAGNDDEFDDFSEARR